MAYLHCHSCSWSQDDFWSSTGWHPFTKDQMDWLRDCLFVEKLRFDEFCFRDMGLPFRRDKDGPYCSGKEYVVRKLQLTSQSVANMRWKTEDEWKVDRENAVCPCCGARDFDID